MLGKHSPLWPTSTAQNGIWCLLKILWKEKSWLQMSVVIQGGLWRYAKLPAHPVSCLIFEAKMSSKKSNNRHLPEKSWIIFSPHKCVFCLDTDRWERPTEWTGQSCRNTSQSRGSSVNWCYGQLIPFHWKKKRCSKDKSTQATQMLAIADE